MSYTPNIKPPRSLDIDMGDGTLSVRYYRDQVTPATIESIQNGDINAMALGLANILFDWSMALQHERVTVLSRAWAERHAQPAGYAAAREQAQSHPWASNHHGDPGDLALVEEQPADAGAALFLLGDAVAQVSLSASAQEVREALYGGDGYVVVEDVPGGWCIDYVVIPSEAQNRTLQVDGDVVVTDRYRENEPRQVAPSFELLRQMDFGFLTALMRGLMRDMSADPGKSQGSPRGSERVARGRGKTR
jgi:hypothetical protein